MIVWINGPFGVGKTTVAERLVADWPGSTLFDPEHLGYLLRVWTPADAVVGDFQDLSVWRALVRETAAGLLRDFGRPLVVPMTLLDPAYFAEVVGRLRADGHDVRHVCLRASRATVVERVAGRGDGDNPFILERYDAYQAALADPAFATVVDTDGRTADAVYAEVVSVLALPALTV